MRRDHFELEAHDVDWVETGDPPAEPRVVIDFHGPAEALTDRLTDADGELLDAGETDVTFRLQDSLDTPDATGVVSVTDRITGDFLLELNEAADDVLRFVRAAREYGQSTDADDGGGRYRVVLRIDGEPLTTYSKSTFLVYDANGSLLRSKSLIPSGVEL